jgi:hypothetical protein
MPDDQALCRIRPHPTVSDSRLERARLGTVTRVRSHHADRSRRRFARRGGRRVRGWRRERPTCREARFICRNHPGRSVPAPCRAGSPARDPDKRAHRVATELVYGGVAVNHRSSLLAAALARTEPPALTRDRHPFALGAADPKQGGRRALPHWRRFNWLREHVPTHCLRPGQLHGVADRRHRRRSRLAPRTWGCRRRWRRCAGTSIRRRGPPSSSG